MSKLRLILERQWLHALLLLLLLAGMWSVSAYDGVWVGQLWDVATLLWLWLAVGLAIAHQVYVWFCWRTELHTSFLSRTLGSRGFPSYAVGFSLIGIFRVVVVFFVAVSNRGTFPLNIVVSRALAVFILLPALYLFYSVKRYFGFRRAFGIDHFDEDYRTRQLERRGIFRYTRNGMYIFGFMLLWVPGLWWNSTAALVVALFNHLYIWVHYYATELPDMRHIYGEAE